MEAAKGAIGRKAQALAMPKPEDLMELLNEILPIAVRTEFRIVNFNGKKRVAIFFDKVEPSQPEKKT